jgi:predicted metalloprotease with PDZ domain
VDGSAKTINDTNKVSTYQMKKAFFLILFFSYAIVSWAQKTVKYTLTYLDNTDRIVVEIDSFSAKSAKLVIPRSGPGTYELTNYIAFVDRVIGTTNLGVEIEGIKGDGSFFIFDQGEENIQKITYEVDLRRMENTLLGGYASSKIRGDYVGILGYSVFGFVEEHEQKPISLVIKTDADWPIFSTLRPSVQRNKGQENYKMANFAELADGQYLLGSAVGLYEVPDSPIPLYIATYSEAEINIRGLGEKCLKALNGLADYFGYIPMPHYTVFYEFLIPVSDHHDYGFNMEHMNSMSASKDTSSAASTFNPRGRIGTIVHHIGHSWIPLRSYGMGYRPFQWQTAPMIETIWLNEGFIWYIAMHEILENQKIISFFNNVISNAPTYIQEKSLRELSLLGSTQYGLDFRIGRNLFSRGAMMAYDMDKKIQRETSGTKTFKDAALGLLQWTEKNQRPFEYHEIEPIMSKATGVRLKEVWDEWQNE